LNKEFSKWLLIQESVLVWITTIAFIVIAFISIYMGYFGELPWLATLCASIWAAYGVSQAFYYKKAMAENTAGGIKYEMVTQSNKIIEFEEEAQG
jgi:hypothetical protein